VRHVLVSDELDGGNGNDQMRCRLGGCRPAVVRTGCWIGPDLCGAISLMVRDAGSNDT
jgi:hypothetical protein